VANIAALMRRLMVPLLLVLLAGAGCENVSVDSIQRWKTTEKGPAKLQDALKDSSVSPALRAQAAVALVELGKEDEVEQALGQLPDRAAVVKELIPLYAEGLKNPDVPRARAARDGLFAARAFAAPEDRQAIDGLLLKSIAEDVRQGRLTGGRVSLEKMVAAMGAPAAEALVGLLDDPRVPFAGVTEILMRVADPPTRERAGAALVRRAQNMANIPLALWRGLGEAGGVAAHAFLMQKVTKGFEKDAIPAAQALQQRPTPQLLPFALAMAGDQKVNKSIREEMFGLIEKIGGPEAQKGLLHVIASDPNELVRYRAYEAAVAAGRAEAVVPALEAFPASATYKRNDVIDFLVKDVTKLGPPARPAVLKALASPATLARMTAVLSLEAPLPSNGKSTLGGPADAPALAKLASDRGTLKGFPVGDTVAREATRVAAVLQRKAP
jgi:hypothetical protein